MCGDNLAAPVQPRNLTKSQRLFTRNRESRGGLKRTKEHVAKSFGHNPSNSNMTDAEAIESENQVWCGKADEGLCRLQPSAPLH
jgi:hypothetical protein